MAMSLNIKRKSKAALQEKTRKNRKHLEHAVSLASMATTASDDLLADLKFERRSISSLKGFSKRVRKSEKDQVESVARSIRRHKQAAPILTDQSGEIINGHIVVQALRSLGATEAWCAVIDHLDEDERALLHVTLNRLGETGDWDLDALGPLLIELDELGFELETTGFSLPELDIIMSPNVEKACEAEGEEIPELPVEPVSVPSDTWLIGDHRLHCGDAADAKSYDLLLDGEVADVIFTDCPWNIPIAGFVSGLGKVRHQDFKMGAGEMQEEEFVDFCDRFHEHGAANLIDGGVFYSCIDWRSADVIMESGRRAGLRHINTAVWNKGSGGMGSPWRSAHEFIVIFCKGKKCAVNNIELGKHGRDRTNVWSYPGANRKGSSASKALANHPTPKPVEMVRDALLDVSNRGGIVLDPFMGSGTTIIAAEQCGRVARGIELDPAYVDVAVRRWEELTGRPAMHAETGLSFAEMAEKRLTQADVADAA